MKISLKLFNNKQKPSKPNNNRHIKAKTEHLKNTENNYDLKSSENLSDTKNRNIRINETYIKNKYDNSNMLEKICYLQLWWKTIFQIIKIQKYLRGFLYRIKLLRLLELKEKMVYGMIQLSKSLKLIIYNVFIKQLEKHELNILLNKKKNYFNKWNSLLIRKSIIEELKKFDRSKIIPKHSEKHGKNKNEKKLKSSSITKRDLQKEKEKKKDVDEVKMRNKDKNMIKDQFNLSSKNSGLQTERINTERNLHNLGSKNNSLEKRKTKKSYKNIVDNNLTNIKSNKDIKNQKNNKKPCTFFKTSSNFLMNKSHNQINNYKSNNNKNRINYKESLIKLSKKNTNVKKNNKMSKNRNRKNISGILNVDTNINKFKSYYVESSRNKGVNSQNKSIKFKKNYELEYISKHENRFHCPKQLYSLNHKKLKKNPSDKLDISLEIYKESSTTKNEDISNHNRARSLETRHKKKYKSFIQNINNINKDNKISNEENLNKDKTCEELLTKNEEKKRIMKSKTKVMKKAKKKKNQKGILKNSSRAINNVKNRKLFTCLDIWRIKNIKKKIINKIRGLSILYNKFNLYYYKAKGRSFIKSLQEIHRFKIMYNYFNAYKNKISLKLILQKLKENNTNLNYEAKEKEDNSINKNIININDKKVKIIEISPYQNTKINSKIKGNYIQNEKNIKLQKLLLIKQKVSEYLNKKKYLYKWKILSNRYEPNLITGIENMKSYYFNNKKNNENENDNQRLNSSYQKKRVKYHRNYNMETSFNDDKLYSRKIVNYFNNNNISINKDDYFNKTLNQGYNYNNNLNKLQQNNINLSPLIEEINTNDNNINVITKTPISIQGVYKKKRVINSKNSNINKNANNSCLMAEVNNSNFELNNTMENEKGFMNNSVVIGRRRLKNNINDEVYHPKLVNPNLFKNDNNYEVTRMYIREPAEFFSKNKYMNNNIPYNKINIRYQKMYCDNDLNSEHRQINFGSLEEQTNEGTN